MSARTDEICQVTCEAVVTAYSNAPPGTFTLLFSTLAPVASFGPPLDVGAQTLGASEATQEIVTSLMSEVCSEIAEVFNPRTDYGRQFESELLNELELYIGSHSDDQEGLKHALPETTEQFEDLEAELEEAEAELAAWQLQSTENLFDTSHLQEPEAVEGDDRKTEDDTSSGGDSSSDQDSDQRTDNEADFPRSTDNDDDGDMGWRKSSHDDLDDNSGRDYRDHTT